MPRASSSGRTSAHDVYRSGGSHCAMRRGVDDLSIHAGVAAEVVAFRPFFQVEEIAEELNTSALPSSRNPSALPRCSPESLRSSGDQPAFSMCQPAFSFGLRSKLCCGGSSVSTNSDQSADSPLTSPRRRDGCQQTPASHCSHICADGADQTQTSHGRTDKGMILRGVRARHPRWIAFANQVQDPSDFFIHPSEREEAPVSTAFRAKICGPTKREIGTMLHAAPAFANHGVCLCCSAFARVIVDLWLRLEAPELKHLRVFTDDPTHARAIMES